MRDLKIRKHRPSSGNTAQLFGAFGRARREGVFMLLCGLDAKGLRFHWTENIVGRHSGEPYTPCNECWFFFFFFFGCSAWAHCLKVKDALLGTVDYESHHLGSLFGEVESTWGIHFLWCSLPVICLSSFNESPTSCEIRISFFLCARVWNLLSAAWGQMWPTGKRWSTWACLLTLACVGGGG